MSTNDLFHALLRPAVLHILRASGFNGAKPSVVDTLVDLTARYLTLLASRTAYNAYSNHNDLTPDISDVRMAMQDCGLLVPSMTAAEEIWKEILRKPLEEYDEESGARAKEEKRRDADDTVDVTAFIDWVKGEQHKEIRRVAGVLKQPQLTAAEQLDTVEMEDYLSCMMTPDGELRKSGLHNLALMKKHSKTGADSRYQGTILGKSADPKPIKIEGGAADSIEEWCQKTREKAVKTRDTTHEDHEMTNHVDEVVGLRPDLDEMMVEQVTQ
jgi:transcription initiation factor TFIID subunit 3